MIISTQIVRLDGMLSETRASQITELTCYTGLVLVASVDDRQMQELGDLKQNVRSIIKKLTPNSEPRASIESAKHSIQYASPASL
jgi:hypothetical protein